MWANGITQKQLAKEVGLCQHTIWRLVNNHYNPSKRTADKIAKFLGCETSEIFSY
jgi:DNA-binding XRE family transcriptional regulator